MIMKWAMSRENLSSVLCNQVRPKQAYSGTEASYSLGIKEITTISVYYLDREQHRR